MEAEDIGAETSDLLIDLIQNYEFLFNISHKEYKNSQKKEAAWLEIATVLKISGKVSIFKYVVPFNILCQVYKSIFDLKPKNVKKLGKLSGTNLPERRGKDGNLGLQQKFDGLCILKCFSLKSFIGQESK